MAEPEEKVKEDLLKRMYGGVILSVEPYITDFETITATSANFLWQGEKVGAIQVVVRGHPDNTGRVWVNVGREPSSADGWPLDANDWVKLTILEMRRLQILIVTDTDKVIIGRSS